MRVAWLLIPLGRGARRPEADGIARALQRGVAPNTTSVLVMRGDAIVVITRTRYSTPGMHRETVRLIEDEILPSPACGVSS